MNTDIRNLSLKNKDITVQNSKCVINKSICNNKPGILLVYANWCGHCTRFKPVYQEINKILNTTRINAPLLALENEEMTDENVVKKLNVRGFPTILFFDQNGVIMDKPYEGERTSQKILQELCNRVHDFFEANEKVCNNYR